MEFSIIVAFKNRDQKRVEYFLESLQWQSIRDFELVVINQGSDEEVNAWLEPLLSRYSFVSYIYNFTRGQFFNKSNALNIGIKTAAGKYIVIADIDIVFPRNYLEKIRDQLSPDLFFTHNAFYLPLTFKIEGMQYFFSKDLIDSCQEKFIGLCVAKKEAFIGINGFDEYFLLWGGEDDDITNRLESSGRKRIHFTAASMNIYHQWHASSAPAYPSPWYLDIVNYLYFEKKKAASDNQKFGVLTKAADRIIEDKLNNITSFKKLDLITDPLFQFTFFTDGFFKMYSGEFGFFEFPILSPPAEGRKQKLINRFNILLSQWELPYRVVKKEISIPVNTRESWKDFVTYFIGKNRALLRDYYIIDTAEKLVFYFQKK